MSALVLGAGGFLGLNLVDALKEAQQEFVCGSRRKAPRIALRRREVTLVHADLNFPESLEKAMAGKTTVYHLAGHYPALSLDVKGTIRLGVRQMGAVLEACAAAGVKRLVYVSSTATVASRRDGSPSDESDVFDRHPSEGVYHRLKWIMETMALGETRFEVKVVCPGACIGPWDQRIGTSAPLVALAHGYQPRLPAGILNIVDVRDAAKAIVACGTLPDAPKRVLVVSKNVQLIPFLFEIAERYGVKGPVELTDDAAKKFALDEERRSLIDNDRPKLSRELVDLIIAGVNIDASLSEEALGLSYRPFEETISDFESWARARRIIPKQPKTGGA